MNSELLDELKRAIAMEDGPAKRDVTKRLIGYMLTLSHLTRDQIVENFATHAFTELPGSNLPALFAQHCGISVSRKRRVSFEMDPIVVPSLFRKSLEWRRQEERESSTLSLTNTDPFRKFKPRECFTKGLSYDTVIVPLVYQGGVNRWEGQPTKSDRTYVWTTEPVSYFLADLSCLDKYSSENVSN